MLTAQDNAALVRAHFDAFNVRDYAKCLATVSDDVQWTNIPFNVAFTGKKAYRDYLENWTTAVPYATVEIVNVVAADGWTAVEFIGRGIHSGSFIGPRGDAPATHRPIVIKFCELIRVDDGLIVEARVYFDGATIMSQLGLVPQPDVELEPEPSIL